MGKQYRTVEGELSGTVNTVVNLTTFGAETGVGPVKVPSGAQKISEIWAAVGATVDTAADSSAYLLRLSGKGMLDGDQDFILGAVGGGVTNTGTAWAPAQKYPVDIGVKANEFITVATQYTGSTIPANTGGITLVFE